MTPSSYHTTHSKVDETRKQEMSSKLSTVVSDFMAAESAFQQFSDQPVGHLVIMPHTVEEQSVRRNPVEMLPNSLWWGQTSWLPSQHFNNSIIS